MNEAKGILKLYLRSSLTDLTVVEPCLGKPPYTCLVSIDADKTRNVEALDVNVESCERIYELTVSNRLRLYFFFTSSPMPGRNIPCCRAI